MLILETMSTQEPAQLARDFIHSTDRHVFLTGRAGTGKTTFLHNLKTCAPKRMVVVAPTGVAAMNAGGVTIHSFFQLPFSRDNAETQNNTFRFNFSEKKRAIFRSLELLVIDEISMVRADVLDQMDEILRRYKYAHTPFGGVQLLMIGDLQQLSPIVTQQEEQFLKAHYPSPYFFHSKALLQAGYVCVELQKMYRQSDRVFIDILNQIRDGAIHDDTLAKLNERYEPNMDESVREGYITLTTHRTQANRINEEKLHALSEKMYTYKAKIEGTFHERIFPCEEILRLKKGTQIMFNKNDSGGRFFNGKIGKIIELNDTEITVLCGEEKLIVTPQTWKNNTYVMDETSKDLREQTIGTFTQFPMQTAWAITVHKSQGLTFDRAIIDVGEAFAPGQIYVALSRLRSLEGLLLSRPVRRDRIILDKTVHAFNAQRSEPDEAELIEAKRTYFLRLLYALFDYENIYDEAHQLRHLYEELFSSAYPEELRACQKICADTERELVRVGAAFRTQIDALTKDDCSPEKNAHLQARIQKAVIYFTDKLNVIFAEMEQKEPPKISNQKLRKNVVKTRGALIELLKIKRATLRAATDGFDVIKHLHAQSMALVEDKNKINENKINKNKINENRVNKNKINENKINENKINENKINESKINESKINESKINESKINESKINESKINENEINESKVANENEINNSINNHVHSILYERLEQWREAVMREKKLPHPNAVLQPPVQSRIAEILPTDLKSLQKIVGIGRETIKNYGHEIIKIVKHYIDTKAQHLSQKDSTETEHIKEQATSHAHKNHDARKQKIIRDYVARSLNPALYEQLETWQKTQAILPDTPHPNSLLSSNKLFAISNRLPINESELRSIQGIGDIIIMLYGAQIVAMVDAYINAHPNAQKSEEKFFLPPASAVPENTAHPVLYGILQKWRYDKAKEKNTFPYVILQQSVLTKIVNELPKSVSELEAIDGIKPISIKEYGQEIMAMIRTYLTTSVQR